MDTLIYSKDQIEKLLNIINTLPLKEGSNFITASKINEIYSIVNSALKPIDKEKPEENKND